MNYKQLFVTGGNGFLGAEVVRTLAQSGADFLYSYRSEPLAGYESQGRHLDLTQPKDYEPYVKELQQVDCLIHTAATVSHGAKTPADDIRTHVVTSVELFTQLAAHFPNLKKIVYVSSCSAEIVDADPTFYGLGKEIMERVVTHYAETQGLHYVNLRFPQLYGAREPHGTFVTKFAAALQNSQPIKLVNNGNVVRDILYVRDAAGAVQQAVSGQATGTYTVAPQQPQTVREVLDALAAAMQVTPQVENTTVPEDQAGKSVHFTSTADALGYQLQYDLPSGFKDMIHAKGER